MPRNSGTGVYSPPPNITAVPLAPVESGDWNALVQDITAVLNIAWPVGLGGTGVSSLTGFLATIGGLPLAGGIMTGPLTLSGDATAALHAVSNQQFVAALANKAAASHTQTAATITDFAAAADARIGAASINALADVTVITPTTGQTLRWNGLAWVNGTPYTEFNLGSFVINSVNSIAHGLITAPSFVQPFLKCRVANQEYSVGDYVSLYAAFQSFSTYYPLWFNATHVGLSPRNAQFLFVTQKTSLGDGSFVNASWDLVFRVWP